MRLVSKRVDLEGFLYPLVFGAIRANFGVILPVALGFSVISAYCRLQMDTATDLDTAVVAYSLFELGALLVADMMILFAVYPWLLSGGLARGWDAVWNTRLLTVTLYASASVSILLVMSIIMGLVGAAGGLLVASSEALLIQEVAALGFTICAVLVLSLFGLTFPHIITTGKLALTQATMWGLGKFPRLAMLISAGFLPLTLCATSMGLWTQDLSLHVEVLADFPLIDWGALALIVIEALITFTASVACAVALAKVYREVAPLDEYSSPDAFGAVFD